MVDPPSKPYGACINCQIHAHFGGVLNCVAGARASNTLCESNHPRESPAGGSWELGPGAAPWRLPCNGGMPGQRGNGAKIEHERRPICNSPPREVWRRRPVDGLDGPDDRQTAAAMGVGASFTGC